MSARVDSEEFYTLLLRQKSGAMKSHENSEVGFCARKCQSLGVASVWEGALISTLSGQSLVRWLLRKRSQT